MKIGRMLTWLLISAAIQAAAFFSGVPLLASTPTPLGQEHEPITGALIDIVDHNPGMKDLLEKSIAMAKKINPDPSTNPAQTLEQYYGFIDWAAKALPWALLPEFSSSLFYERIDQGLAYFYFINDQPLDELNGKGYYRNSIQYHEPYRTWVLSFVREWGRFLSTQASWSDEYYRMALADPRFGLGNGWYEDPSNWKSFNDFFSRHLSSPGMRPVAGRDDPSVVSSPGDSRPFGAWTIDKNSGIKGGQGVQVKSRNFETVASLLGPESAYKDAFADGIMTFAYLDEYDYHRCHFPVSGTILEARIIAGGAPSGGITMWDEKTKRYVFDPGEPGWQSLETRGCIVVKTAQAGLIALIPVGMSQIASVNFEENVKTGNQVEKGDKLCYYLFGGSGFVMLFQKEAEFRLTSPGNENGSFSHVLAGEEVGRIRTGKQIR